MKWYARRDASNVVQLYPGSLDGLEQAQEDAMRLSAGGKVSTTHVYTTEAGLVQIGEYEDGRLAWSPGTGLQEGG